MAPMNNRALDQALIVAAKALDVDAVRELLQEGADPNAQDWQDPNPPPYSSVLDVVIHNRDMFFSDERDRLRSQAARIVELLLKAGARPQGTAHGEVLLVLVAKKGLGSIVRLLVEHGSDPNCESSSCERPIHCAVCTCDLETVKSLVEHGADVNTNGFFDRSPRYIALVEGRNDVAAYLRSVGGRVVPDPRLPPPAEGWEGRGVYLSPDELDERDLD
jgi:ankyrin repeat protein